MSQEPWNEEVYQAPASRRDRISNGLASTRIFTVLAIIFFIIVVVIGIGAIYLSTGGSTTNSTQEFHNSSASTEQPASSAVTEETSEVVAPSESEQTQETPASSSLAEASDGSTLTVQAGEGLGQIAARAGISIADLERLNPEKMTTGSWLAHPGDVVRIR